MKDLMGMMKNLQGMQKKMEDFQASLADLEIEGRSGGGLVTVTISGKGEMKRVHVDPSLFKEDDVAILEDLIVAAHNDAKSKSESEINARMQEVTAGLPLPPGMKFPF